MNISKFPLHIFRRTFSKIKVSEIPNPSPELNLTICGANSKIGRLTTLLFKRESLFKNVVLWDDQYDMTELVKTDLCTIKTNTNLKMFCGRKGLVDAVSDSRIIYICDNIQTIPGVSQMDLFKANVNQVRQVILYVSEFNPTAMIVIGTPCVTSLVPMAYEEMLKNDCDASKQIFGLARNYLESASSVAKSLSPHLNFEGHHGVIGGCDKDTCFPVFSKSVSGRTLSVPDFSHHVEGKKLKGVKDVLKDFQNAEENVLKTKVLETNADGCYLSLAATGFHFIRNLGLALRGQKNITDYAFVRQKNPRNHYERYLTCKVSLNEEGLESCNLPTLTPEEEVHLKAVDKQLNSFIHAGEVYITGRDQVPEHRKQIEKPPKDVKPDPPDVPAPKVDVFCTPRPKLKTIQIKST